MSYNENLSRRLETDTQFKNIYIPELNELKIDMFGNVVERDNQPVVTYEHSGVDSLSFNGTYYPIYHLVGKTWSNDERSIKFRESPYFRVVKAYERSVLYPIFTNCSYAVDPDGNIFVVKDGIWQKAIDICGTDDYESESFNRLRRLVVYTYVKWKVPRDEYIRGLFGIDIDTYSKFLNNGNGVYNKDHA